MTSEKWAFRKSILQNLNALQSVFCIVALALPTSLILGCGSDAGKPQDFQQIIENAHEIPKATKDTPLLKPLRERRASTDRPIKGFALVDGEIIEFYSNRIEFLGGFIKKGYGKTIFDRTRRRIIYTDDRLGHSSCCVDLVSIDLKGSELWRIENGGALLGYFEDKGIAVATFKVLSFIDDTGKELMKLKPSDRYSRSAQNNSHLAIASRDSETSGGSYRPKSLVLVGVDGEEKWVATTEADADEVLITSDNRVIFFQSVFLSSAGVQFSCYDSAGKLIWENRYIEDRYGARSRIVLADDERYVYYVGTRVTKIDMDNGEVVWTWPKKWKSWSPLPGGAFKDKIVVGDQGTSDVFVIDQNGQATRFKLGLYMRSWRVNEDKLLFVNGTKKFNPNQYYEQLIDISSLYE